MRPMEWVGVGIWGTFGAGWLWAAWRLHKAHNPNLNMAAGLWLLTGIVSLLAAVLTLVGAVDVAPTFAFTVALWALAVAVSLPRRREVMDALTTNGGKQ